MYLRDCDDRYPGVSFGYSSGETSIGKSHRTNPLRFLGLEGQRRSSPYFQSSALPTELSEPGVRKRVSNRPSRSESSPRGRFRAPGAIIPGSRRRGFIGGDAKFIESDPKAEAREFEMSGNLRPKAEIDLALWRQACFKRSLSEAVPRVFSTFPTLVKFSFPFGVSIVKSNCQHTPVAGSVLIFCTIPIMFFYPVSLPFTLIIYRIE